jgi:hypothetical protein
VKRAQLHTRIVPIVHDNHGSQHQRTDELHSLSDLQTSSMLRSVHSAIQEKYAADLMLHSGGRMVSYVYPHQ